MFSLYHFYIFVLVFEATQKNFVEYKEVWEICYTYNAYMGRLTHPNAFHCYN